MTGPIQASRRRVLVDTSAYFGLIDPRDGNHDAAKAVQERLIDGRWRLFTTNFVVAETHSLILNRVGRDRGVAFLRSVDLASEAGDLTIIRATIRDEQQARAIIRQYSDKDFSLTDATSFAIMERADIRHAFTFDRHFSQYGFLTL